MIIGFFDRTVIGKILRQCKRTPHAFYGNNYFVDQCGKVNRIWKPGGFARWKYFYGWMTPHPATIIPKLYYDSFGNYDESYDIAADYGKPIYRSVSWNSCPYFHYLLTY